MDLRLGRLVVHEVTVAALYVETNGVYYGLPDVDPWDEQRDARLYAGPWPVVAQPPATRGCETLWSTERSKTPPAFRDVLLDMARSVAMDATITVPAVAGGGGSMKVDLERLRRSLVRYVYAEESAVPVAVGELEALLAVVDAARGPARYISALRVALEPFTPSERDLAVKAAVDATPKPTHSGWALLREQDCEPLSPEARREWTRDYVALVGEVVQRQFRSDQERIAELEAELADGVEERDALRKELAEARQALDQWGRDAVPRP